jgi:hypothetical protein
VLAAAAGHDTGYYWQSRQTVNHHLLGLFDRATCGQGAWGYPGESTLDTGGIVTIDDLDWEGDPDMNLEYFAHEIGHTFSIDHNEAERCVASALAQPSWNMADQALADDCTPYSDPWPSGLLNDTTAPATITSLNKYELGIIEEGAGVVIVDAPTTGVTVELTAAPYIGTATQLAVAVPPGGVQGIVSEEPYANWADELAFAIDYRAAAPEIMGADAEAGVYITATGWYEHGQALPGSFVLQPVGGGYDKYYALKPGETFTSSDGQVRITTLSADGQHATVKIEIDEAPAPQYRSQADLVLVQGSDERSINNMTWGTFYARTAWSLVKEDAALLSREFGVDWQFTDHTEQIVTLEPGTCADADKILAAIGRDRAYYTEGTGDGVNHHLIAVYDSYTCAQADRYHTLADPATLDTGGIIVVPEDEDDWPPTFVYSDLLASFGLNESKANRCTGSSITSPTWNLAQADATLTCWDGADPWTTTTEEAVVPGYIWTLPQRLHITALEKYEVGAIRHEIGAVVIDGAEADKVVDLVQVPAATPGYQAVIIWNNVESSPGYGIPYGKNWNTLLGVEYRSAEGDAPAGVYVTLNSRWWDIHRLSEPFLLQPLRPTGAALDWVPLGVGETFTTSDGLITITVESVTADKATVHVVKGAAASDGDDDDDNALNSLAELLRRILELIREFIKSLLALFG